MVYKLNQYLYVKSLGRWKTSGVVARYRRELLIDQANSASTMAAAVASAGQKVIQDKDREEEREREEEEALLL